MSIDLSVVGPVDPDLEAAQRLAVNALGSLESEVDPAGVLVHVSADGFHEFGDERFVTFTAPYREPASYVAVLTLASAVAVLGGGRVVDEADFFPALTPREVLKCCLEDSSDSAQELWTTLRDVAAADE